MNFGGALECLKRGMKVEREHWADAYLMLQVPDEFSKMTKAYVFVVVPEKHIVPWTPTQIDILAEDWILV